MGSGTGRAHCRAGSDETGLAPIADKKASTLPLERVFIWISTLSIGLSRKSFGVNTISTVIDAIFSIGTFACIMANLTHWRGRHGTKWYYVPAAGWSKSLFNTLIIVVPVTAGLFLCELIHPIVFLSLATAYIIWIQLYSISARERAVSAE